MDDGTFKVRYNVMNLSSVDTFASIKGGFNRNCKDVNFLRMIGVDPSLKSSIEKMDFSLSENMAVDRSGYYRVNELPRFISVEDAAYYTNCYVQMQVGNMSNASVRTIKTDHVRQEILGQAVRKAAELYQAVTGNTNESLVKNFIVKLLFWYDNIVSHYPDSWNTRTSVKFVAKEISKVQEYLFCYLLTLTGIDVLLLQCGCDISQDLKKLGLSKEVRLGEFGDCDFPEYDFAVYKDGIQAKKTEKRTEKIAKKVPDIKTETVSPHKVYIPPKQTAIQQIVSQKPLLKNRAEMEFEELARLASSVVMIGVHDRKGEVNGTGSGIMIGREGYILTNSHVASGGRFYSVRVEDDDKIYSTDEVIKYNTVLDLAVLRIDRRLDPIPVYRGEKKLVRGQKVVAIGSPLGLFNSVSDGIISGFREIDGVDMIQFTAPISHGSSGGAVLNMFGEVIGISTAGIERGQNVNLAVGYECINLFIRGFV